MKILDYAFSVFFGALGVGMLFVAVHLLTVIGKYPDVLALNIGALVIILGVAAAFIAFSIITFQEARSE